MAKLACHPSFVIDKPLVHSELGVKPQINSSGGGSMGNVGRYLALCPRNSE